MSSPWSGMVYIADPRSGNTLTDMSRHESVDEVGVQGDLVFGRIAYQRVAPPSTTFPSGTPPGPWFRLNTRTGEWNRFDTREAWLADLSAAGLRGEPRLHRPSPWWFDLFIWSFFGSIFAPPLLGGLAVWWSIAARRRRQRRDARMHAEFNEHIRRRVARAPGED
ncbi:MAG: hypothetical protein IT436_01160 [Phycisphaerales bacterium]|nr:hypothetical protein [Phycisphaerales bacterium]